MAIGKASTPGRRRRRRAVGGVLVLAALAVAGLLLVGPLTQKGEESGGEIRGAPGAEFTMSYPASWRPDSETELEGLPGSPLAVIRHSDGEGLVVIQRKGRAPRKLTAFADDLTRELARRIPDFRKQSSGTVRVRAGRAFKYTYIRRRRGTVHAVVLVPAESRSFVLNTVSKGGADEVAREIGVMIRSFDTRG